MNIATLFLNSARSFGYRPAVSLGKSMIFDYRELGRRSASLAATFGRRRRPGDRIAIALPNCVEYLEILLGAWAAGLAVAPLNARLSPAELAYMIEDCGAGIAFASEEMANDLASLLPKVSLVVPSGADYARMLAEDPVAPVERAASDLAWIFYTSGTTGKPKGAMLSHGALSAVTHAYFADIDFLNERDALLHLAATSHASGLFGLSHLAKASNHVLPESGGFDPDEFTGLVGTYTNLTFFVPPTVLRRIGRDPIVANSDLSHVKTVLLGAAPVSLSDIEAGHALFGPKLWHGYGQGESPCTITAMSKSMIGDALAEGRADRLASVGVVRTGIEIRIVDGEGRQLPDGETGEVIVRGATVMQGYLNRPEASNDALREGWLYTGDLGRVNGEGFLTLLDRKKDLIISGGVNIYAREIEDVLIESPQVLEAAVIGIPDPEWGESVMAVVVARPGAVLEASELDKLCLNRVARFKRPKRYAFVEALPKNASGKVLKGELRGLYATETFG